MTTEEIDELPWSVPVQTAAKMLDINYETFRRWRAVGRLRGLQYYPKGDGVRRKVVTSSVLRVREQLVTSDPE